MVMWVIDTTNFKLKFLHKVFEHMLMDLMNQKDHASRYSKDSHEPKSH